MAVGGFWIVVHLPGRVGDHKMLSEMLLRLTFMFDEMMLTLTLANVFDEMSNRIRHEQKESNTKHEVKLLGYWSIPFCRRIDLALNLKGVSFTYIEDDISKKSELLLAYNPIYQELPVLIHEGRPVTGSLVILEYIDDTWGGLQLLPKDPYDRAHARFLAKFIDEKCVPAFRTLFWEEGNVQNPMEESKENLKFLENELKGKTFFGGESIGFVDIAANYVAFWIGVLQEMAEIDLFSHENFPVLWEWSQKLLACDAVTKSLPNREKLLTYFRARKRSLLVAKPSEN